MAIQNDPFQQFKSVQREGWSLFAPVENMTTPPAAKLVKFAKIEKGQKVLDVGCGTGVVALTAARKGAQVKGLDLSPALIEKAKWNAQLINAEIDFVEGDAEALPYGNGEFDVVLSQFGHMFAPRPEVTISEMLRVLKPGGTIAFSTWPPELFTGRMFALTAKYVPPPEGVAPPPQWGNPQIIRERLGDKVVDLTFDRDVMAPAALSAQHYRTFMEATVGPLSKLVQNCQNDPTKLRSFRTEFEALISEYMDDNVVRMSFIMTRAKKV